ncbi:hypothetical protein AB0M43_10220 [Longispora sp. NPDC051575]|uniref:SHOCT-like domain-containing protein n=1 Tax=Longispora sp. NPDC051575 TaxID=3154943 RepID=UPI00342343B1
MSEERMQVLRMVASGQITAEEGEQLLAVLGHDSATAAIGSAPPVAPGKARYLRVVVAEGDDETGKHATRVNLRVPVQLLRAGMKLGTMLPDRAKDTVNDVLRQKGAAFDVSTLKTEDLDLLLEHLDDVTVDVENEKNNKNSTVRFFVER